MKKTILASMEGGETRICMLTAGRLVNVDAEGGGAGGTLNGNIYKGRVTSLIGALNAGFVDIGEGKEGFLSIHDVHPALFEGQRRRPDIRDVFQSGQEILVQVAKDAVGEKGPSLTTCISLPGRYVVLVPASERTGISRKLPDEERRRLREIIDQVEVPEGFGVIVRTAGQDKTERELLKDLNQLIALWKQIEEAYVKTKAPALLLREQTVVHRFLREYLTADVDEIVVDHRVLHDEVGRFLDFTLPGFRKALSLYQDRLPLFVRYNVESQLEKMYLRDVPLPSGGRIVIDRTEALTAIDVNSGRVREKHQEETALKANLEAAEEIASQIILRDLGGLIVIDFIDMEKEKNNRQVEQVFRECFRDDKARFNMGRISEFGLLEMTRQRIRPGVVSRSMEPCRVCDGLGMVRSAVSSSLYVVRRIRELAVAGNAQEIMVIASVEVANFLQNNLRGHINRLENEHGVRITIIGRADVYEETVEAVKKPEQRKAERPPALINRYDLVDEVPEPPQSIRVPAQKPAAKEPEPGRRGRRTRPEQVPAVREARSRGRRGETGRDGDRRSAPLLPLPEPKAPAAAAEVHAGRARHGRGRGRGRGRDFPEPPKTSIPANAAYLPPPEPAEPPPKETKEGLLDAIIRKLLRGE